ncbi:MAG: ABC transporter substrate-binding protein [Deltaproteobacteria bacterium]|nr:ABC transporter substrate-binding protein [Deltaproteobacteria bacterium]
MRTMRNLLAVFIWLFALNAPLYAANKFRVVSGGFGVNHAPVWAAYDQGIFKKYGLDVEYLAINSGSTAMQSLLAGEVEVLNSTGALAVGANLQGADLVIIAGGVNILPYQLIARSEIKRREDLAGKTVAISAFGTSSELGMQVALEKLGINPKQVTMIQAGGNTNRIAALSGRAVYATVVGEPYATLAVKNLGMNSLVDLGEIGTPFPFNCFMVKRSYLKTGRNNIINFVKAAIEGLYTVKKDTAFGLRLIKKYMRLDDEKARIGYDYYLVKHGYELLHLPDRQGLAFAISLINQQNPKAKDQTPESLRLLEPGILEEIKKSGFIEKLPK